MRIEYKDGKIQFNVLDLLDSIPAEAMPDFLESVSTLDTVIQHVSDQIIRGFTENGSSGASFVFTHPEPNLPLEKAWREVAKASGEVAKSEIQRLESALARSEKELQDARQELSDLRYQTRRCV